MILVSAQALAAAQSAPVAVPTSLPSSQDQLIQVALALAVVLALIYGLAWLVRRKQVIQGFTNVPMRTIGVLPMGVKEKIVLIEVGGKQILLGMTPNSINTLATFDEPIIDIKEQHSRSFSQKLKSILAQQELKADNPSQAKANHDDE